MAANSDLVNECRICGANKFIEIIDFGNVALTGVFEKNGKAVPSEPMILVRCDECSYAQLAHSYRQEALYGETYGYESHLNKSMVEHLQQKASILERKYLDNASNKIVVDIASNDGTFLSGFGGQNLTKVGVDPLISIVSDFYPSDSHKISSFFSSKAYFDELDKPARLVTSMSVLYDLNDPISFAKEIFNILGMMAFGIQSKVIFQQWLRP